MHQRQPVEVVEASALEAANQERESLKRQLHEQPEDFVPATTVRTIQANLRDAESKLAEAEKRVEEAEGRRLYWLSRYQDEAEDKVGLIEDRDRLLAPLTNYERAIRELVEAAEGAWPTVIQAAAATALRKATKSARSALRSAHGNSEATADHIQRSDETTPNRQSKTRGEAGDPLPQDTER